MDTAKLSVRKATAVVASTAGALSVDVAKTNINKSTLHRSQQRLRIKNAQTVKDQFKKRVHRALPLTVHWDGKGIKNPKKGIAWKKDFLFSSLDLTWKISS